MSTNLCNVSTENDVFMTYNADKYMIFVNKKFGVVFIFDTCDGSVKIIHSDKVIDIDDASIKYEYGKFVVKNNINNVEFKTDSALFKITEEGKIYIYASEDEDVVISGKVVRVAADAFIINGEYAFTNPIPNVTVLSKEGIPMHTSDKRHTSYRDLIKTLDEIKKRMEGSSNAS